jgi:hypothetical protein
MIDCPTSSIIAISLPSRINGLLLRDYESEPRFNMPGKRANQAAHKILGFGPQF